MNELDLYINMDKLKNRLLFEALVDLHHPHGLVGPVCTCVHVHVCVYMSQKYENMDCAEVVPALAPRRREST